MNIHNIFHPCPLPRLVSNMEKKMLAAQDAFDSFEDVRSRLGDTKRTAESLGFFVGPYWDMFFLKVMLIDLMCLAHAQKNLVLIANISHWVNSSQKLINKVCRAHPRLSTCIGPFKDISIYIYIYISSKMTHETHLDLYINGVYIHIKIYLVVYPLFLVPKKKTMSGSSQPFWPKSSY